MAAPKPHQRVPQPMSLPGQLCQFDPILGMLAVSPVTDPQASKAEILQVDARSDLRNWLATDESAQQVTNRLT